VQFAKVNVLTFSASHVCKGNYFINQASLWYSNVPPFLSFPSLSFASLPISRNEQTLESKIEGALFLFFTPFSTLCNAARRLFRGQDCTFWMTDRNVVVSHRLCERRQAMIRHDRARAIANVDSKLPVEDSHQALTCAAIKLLSKVALSGSTCIRIVEVAELNTTASFIGWLVGRRM
jgi:hypothetical protein